MFTARGILRLACGPRIIFGRAPTVNITIILHYKRSLHLRSIQQSFRFHMIGQSLFQKADRCCEYVFDVRLVFVTSATTLRASLPWEQSICCSLSVLDDTLEQI